MELSELNQPVIMELKFDAPLKGESKYGQYFAYAVDCNGEEMTFFSPSDEVNQKLITLKRGSKVQITKTAKQNGKGIVVNYDVVVLDETKPDPAPETIANNSHDDFFYNAMEKSVSDAIRIQNMFPGVCSTNSIAVTIYISRLKQTPSFDGG